MRAARAVLLAAGLVIIGVGVVLAWQRLTLGQLVGLAVWLACAIVVHDGVLAPGTAVLSRRLERAGHALVPSARAVIRVGFVVGAVLTLVAAPEIAAQAQGNTNPTVLTRPYVATLAWCWLAVVVAVLLGVLVAQRRPNVRAS